MGVSRYTQKQRVRLVREWQAGTKTAFEFCQCHGLALSTFRHWIDSVRQAGAESAHQGIAVVPARVVLRGGRLEMDDGGEGRSEDPVIFMAADKTGQGVCHVSR